MSKKKSNKKQATTSFAMQATILAGASIISKLIGMLYQIPFANILSKEGNGYYGAAQTVYGLILLIATFSIPAAVSKIMAEYIERGEYRNVKKIFNGAMLYVLIVGGVAAVFTYIAAPLIVTENAILSLRVLAPTVFLSGFLSVYRGYFQAYGNMVPTSISQVVEQIFNAIFSIGTAMYFMILALKHGIPQGSVTYDSYGAAGGTVGTGVAVLAGLVYMAVLFRKQRGQLKERIANDHTKNVLSYRQVIKLLVAIATPIIFSSFIYNVNVTLDMKIFQKMSAMMGYGTEVIDGQYGLYNRNYLVLANVPIAMAAAVAAAIIPGVARAHAANNREGCNAKIQQSIWITMVMTVPCAVGFAVLGKPIVNLVYYNLSEADVHMVAMLLALGGASIILYGVSSVLNSVLQGIGKVNVPVMSSAVALVLHLFILIPLIGIFKIGCYSFVFATAFYAVVVVFMNYREVRKCLGFRLEWKPTIFVPVVSAVVMGVTAAVIYRIMYCIMRTIAGDRTANAVAVLVSICIAAGVYFIAMIKIGGYTKEELLAFPKGNLVVRLAQRLHLI